MLAERVDLEGDLAAVGAGDGLGFQIDGQAGIGAALGVVHQEFELLGRHLDGQNAVLEAVVVEDVGEGRGDHAANAEVEQRPGRVLARRAAAEIVARHEDLGIAVSRLVEDEVRVLRAVPVEARLGEQAGAEAGALDRLQIVLGDDHVGVDVDDRQWRRDPGQAVEFLHGSIPLARRSCRRMFLARGDSMAPPTRKPRRGAHRPGDCLARLNRP